MGAIAAGKVNASEATEGMRIIVKVSADGTVTPSRTKTGEGVQVTTITEKGFRAAGRYEARGKYVIHTGAGSFDAAPIQTMFLAPEDPAGIKRAYAEALIEDAARPVAEVETETTEAVAAKLAREEGTTPAAIVAEMDEAHEATTARCENEWHRTAPSRARLLCPECPAPFTLTEAEIEENAAQSERENLAGAEAARDENEAPGGIYHGTVWASPTARRALHVQMVGRVLRMAPPALVLDLPPVAAGKELVRIADLQDLTLNSHAGKVDHMNNDANATQTETPAVIRETTGSAVVKLLERVHERIRQNHPEVPAVVIVTGAGIGVFGGKWGHFRPQGWTAKDEADKATHIHEMFMAGETLAKGSRQVLQTMLHESAHALAEHRGAQDTSRQGRWHNKVFLATAQELGLEYRKDKANPQIGYSEVVLKDETVEEYRDLLDALDAEIHLMVRLPGWLGGSSGKDGDDEDGESNGGENMGKAPKTGDPKPNTNNIKCVCDCEEPNIIRMSRKVLAQGVVRCDECEGLFHEAA
jgi:hypothetical protein